MPESLEITRLSPVGPPDLQAFSNMEALHRHEYGMFRHSPLENRLYSGLPAGDQGENRGFSTIFSTVVENFGGRPYAGRREATVT
jgi:hypothetical protein